ncbi:methyltransferase [Trypanosoma conorhini]|uniref:Methyltransferase n=1 Tax=Trypanosoma conorhini TaxID=83891 RepID=A0A3R7N5T4_9TRYP|nr:methyltransferase [Trypanosoma conorhini]RNF25872.1 methyltransferase [Trypanosoma conorhini]
MEAGLEAVVAALQGRIDPSRPSPHPSRAYGIAWELVQALAAAERRRQLLRLLTLFEQCQEDCTAGHVVSAGALVSAGGLVSDDDVRRWEGAMHSMLLAHPSFAKDVVSAVCFCVAQMAVRYGSVALVGAAGASLQNVAATARLPEEVATELLVECADALVKAHREEGEGAADAAEQEELGGNDGLRDALIGYALDALSCRRWAVGLSSLLSRRVLIPLLLCGGHESLGSHHARVQALLRSLAAETARQEEVVVLTAALFEYLFRFTDGDKDRDHRCSPQLWNTLHAAFWDALTCDADAGRRGNMQLRVEYLLKRIVDLTHEQATRKTWDGNVFFHEYFVWTPAVSHNQWGLFFLVAEATNEFGLHIIQPALPKLDALVEALTQDAAAWAAVKAGGNDDAVTARTHFVSGFHPAWVELLFLKMLLHPNTAVRKAGLRRLWSLSTPVLKLFSSVFLFTNAVEAAVDSRLCAEVDRAPHVAIFSMAKGFEGAEVRALGGVAGPLADQLERFYARVFRDVLRTAQERKEAMCRFLHGFLQRPSVYGVTMLLRLLHGVAEALSLDAEERSREATVEMVTATEFLQTLLLVLRDAAHDGVPFWLDVRLSAVAFSALLHFARIDPAVVRQCDGFWKLLCVCGPLGSPGGGSAAAIDAVGHIGALGTSIHPCFFNEQLLRMSRAAPFGGSELGLMRTLLRTDRLREEVRQFLRLAAFDEVRGKQLFFLCGALHLAEPEDRQLLADVAQEIGTTLLSFEKRPYSPAASLLTALVAFVEFHHSVGTVACTRYYSPSMIAGLRGTLHTVALSALRQATRAMAHVNSFEDFREGAWALQHTAAWDVVTAAALSAGQIAVAHDPAAATTWPQSQACVTDALELLLLDADGPPAAAAAEDTVRVTRHFAKMVVARNISCLLQSVLSSLIAVEAPGSAVENVDTAEVACRFPPGTTDPVQWIRCLMRCPSLRLLTCDVPCPLTSLSWATLLAQYYGGVYNAVSVLCGCVDPQESQELLLELQDYALDHVERCWGTNLASVYDILAWVANGAAATGRDAGLGRGVDHRAIIDAMFGHLRDVGAREHGRVSALAFNALRCGVAEHVDLVKSHIARALRDEADSERSVYMAAVTIATEVLRDPAANWPRLKDLLLHVAVLYNSGRDEEGSEMMVAATEPVLLLWPEALRVQYPPTVRLSAVGRALAIATILWCCHLRHDWATSLTLELLDWNTSHVAVKHEPCMPNSKPHRCRIRLWQLLCALLPMIDDDAAAQQSILRRVVQACLPLTNMGSVRRLMEVYALKILERQPALYTLLDAAMTNYSLRPQVCGSYLLIMAHMILRQIRGEVACVDGLFAALLHRLFQQSTSHQHLLRIICHVGLYHIHAACASRGVTFPPTEEMVFDYIARAPEHVKFRDKHAEQLFFNLAEACSPRQLFCIQRREGSTILMESIPAAAFERMRFLDHEFRCLIGALSPVEMLRVRRISDRIDSRRLLEPFKNFPYIPHTAAHTTYCVDYTAEAVALLMEDGSENKKNNSSSCGGGRDTNNSVGDGDENIQRKVTPWWNSLVYNELHPRALKHKKRQTIIVVSSLLQNPVNVAGLFRCGEIFTAEKIVVSDPAVFEHPHFVAAARSAELWLPWDAVPAKSLPPYLDSLRRDGYTLIGIEQTAGSVPMASYQFPKRAVILLGAEGHGVPAELLPLLDVCVEIPQFGLIRSLNVHVTGALVLYEYTRQHLMS